MGHAFSRQKLFSSKKVKKTKLQISNIFNEINTHIKNILCELQIDTLSNLTSHLPTIKKNEFSSELSKIVTPTWDSLAAKAKAKPNRCIKSTSTTFFKPVADDTFSEESKTRGQELFVNFSVINLLRLHEHSSAAECNRSDRGVSAKKIMDYISMLLNEPCKPTALVQFEKIWQLHTANNNASATQARLLSTKTNEDRALYLPMYGAQLYEVATCLTEVVIKLSLSHPLQHSLLNAKCEIESIICVIVPLCQHTSSTAFNNH